MNSCGKSFHIDSKAVFSSVMLVGFVVIIFDYYFPASRPTHDNQMD